MGGEGAGKKRVVFERPVRPSDPAFVLGSEGAEGSQNNGPVPVGPQAPSGDVDDVAAEALGGDLADAQVPAGEIDVGAHPARLVGS